MLIESTSEVRRIGSARFLVVLCVLVVAFGVLRSVPFVADATNCSLFVVSNLVPIQCSHAYPSWWRSCSVGVSPPWVPNRFGCLEPYPQSSRERCKNPRHDLVPASTPVDYGTRHTGRHRPPFVGPVESCPAVPCASSLSSTESSTICLSCCVDDGSIDVCC